ncbi:MAG: hypothetical protein HUJ30_01440 [Gammaproteobacteria bacterium]|nr:hypothetical protein [Gammaproteobacteria bacterium]
MKKLALILFLPFIILATPVMAGPGTAGHSHDDGHGHSHGPVSEKDVIKKAQRKIAALARSGKIDASWANVKEAKTSKKDFGKGPEWVVMFKNAKVKASNKQTLYVFYTMSGRYLATNYTGN